MSKQMTDKQDTDEPKQYAAATDVLLEYLEQRVAERRLPEIVDYKDWLYAKAYEEVEL